MSVNAQLAQDAKGMLERANYPCNEIVSVDRDSILFLGLMRRPHTAWLDEARVVKVDDGFIAAEPAGLHA